LEPQAPRPLDGPRNCDRKAGDDPVMRLRIAGLDAPHCFASRDVPAFRVVNLNDIWVVEGHNILLLI
jgi:hypothetical protein